MDLLLTHCDTDGTLLDGTSRGDGTAEIIKPLGWRWSSGTCPTAVTTLPATTGSPPLSPPSPQPATRSVSTSTPATTPSLPTSA